MPVERDFITPDLSDGSLTINQTGVYDIAMALNVTFSSGDTLDVTAYIDGGPTSIETHGDRP